MESAPLAQSLVMSQEEEVVQEVAPLHEVTPAVFEEVSAEKSVVTESARIDEKMQDLNLEEEKQTEQGVECFKCEGTKLNRKGLPCRRCNGTGEL